MKKMPSLRLVVAAAITLVSALFSPSGASANAINAYGTSPSIIFGTGTTSATVTEKMRITAGGLVGIGNTSPSEMLHVGNVSGTRAFFGEVGANRRGMLISAADFDLIPGPPYVRLHSYDYANNRSINLIINSFNNSNGGLVGIGAIGNNTPSATLHLGGSLRLGAETSATLAVCDTNRAGTIKYESSTFSTCNGTAWSAIGSGSSSATIISGTTTMIPNWPDGIVCANTAQGSDVYYNAGYRASGNKMLYEPAWDDSSSGYAMTFNATSGAYLGGAANFVGQCANKSITQLYTEGRAFNFIGNADANGLKDRIVSGTTGLYAYADTSASIATAGVERMVIGTNGIVGIAQQPVTGMSLAVSGSTMAQNQYLMTSGLIAAGDSALTISGTTAAAASLRVTRTSGNSYGPILYVTKRRTGATGQVLDGDMLGGIVAAGFDQAGNRQEAGTLGFMSNGNMTSTDSSSNFYINLAAPSSTIMREVIRINASGNFGIGTSTPTAPLHVSGTIRATQYCDINGANCGIPGSSGGDRLTSGTLGLTLNSPTSIISLTTGATTWGYLGSTASYLPNLASNAVSTSTVSTTAVQLASSTVITCNSSSAGTLRYASATTTIELCTGSSWQPMGVGIPAGTISAFASTTCPTGWSEYTAARGRFLRGIDNSAGNDAGGNRAPGSTQTDTIQNISGTISEYYGGANVGGGTGAFASVGSQTGAVGSNLSVTKPYGYDFDASRVARTSSETRPKNVAVTFCQFNGTSNGWNNPLSGGSTVPGGNTSQIQYNTSGAFDASSGLTWTNATGTLNATRISTTNISVTTINGVAPGTGSTTFANLTDVSVSIAGNNIYGPGSLTGAVAGYAGNTAMGVNAMASASNAGQQNSGFGAYALNAITSGDANAAMGYMSLDANTTGANNTATGATSLYSNTSGAYNAAFGRHTLYTNTTADYNSAFGALAGRYKGNGNNNTLLGYSSGAGVNGTSAYVNNTAVGAFSGAGLTTGGSNTLIGYNAGAALTTATGNIVIGAQTTPFSNTGNNQLNIGNAIWGNIGFGTANANRIGINVTSPTANLQVSGTISATSLIAGNITVTTINGAVPGSGGATTLGALNDVSLTSPTSANSALIYDGTNWVNKFLQDTVSSTTITPGWPDAIYCTGSQGSLTMTHSHVDATPTHYYRLVGGSPDNQIAFNSSGAYVSSAQTGTYITNCVNKSISQLYAAGQAFNFIGGSGPTNSGDRIVSGTTGIYTTVNTSTSIATAGVERMVIGTSGRIGIGQQPATDAALAVSSTMRVGQLYMEGNNAAQNRLEIGYGTTTSKDAYVDLIGDTGYADFGLRLWRTGGGENLLIARGNNGLELMTQEAAPIKFTTGSTLRMQLNANGRLGIGTTSPGAELDVSGSIQYSGSISDVSDRRRKTNIEALPVPSAIQVLSQLTPVQFEMKTAPGTKEWGFIAQDVEKVLPLLVNTLNDKDQTKTLNYVGLIPVLVKSAQELAKENEQLKARVETLEQRLEKVEKLLQSGK